MLTRGSSVLLIALLAACASSSPQPQTAQNPPPNAPYPNAPYANAPYPYPPQPYPVQPYPSQPYSPPPQPYPPPPYAPAPQPSAPPPAPAAIPPAPAPQPPAASTQLLPPLVGPAAWQQEVRSVLAELIPNLSPENQAKVRGIPLVFDPNPFEINAYAGCNDQGKPFLAATEGLLEAVDAISQTKASDELFGTHSFDQYAGAVIPRLAQSDKASAALPLGTIPMNLLADPRRLSRAHEWFDDLVAFTFGHELGHHYLGHTLCANGQTIDNTPAIIALPQLLARAVPTFNQPNEIAADSVGMVNVLDTGRARMPRFRWSEAGALTLLDFFSRLERASGISPLNPIGILRTHPNPSLRIPIVQTVARTWHLQHPG